MRKLLSKIRLTAGCTMQTSSDNKVYGLTQWQLKCARYSMECTTARTGKAQEAHALAMLILKDVYEKNRAKNQ